MQEEIVFADGADEAALQRLLLDCGMDLAGEIEEHILIKRAGEILGGALLAPMSDGVYHLLLLAVIEPERKKGWAASSCGPCSPSRKNIVPTRWR